MLDRGAVPTNRAIDAIGVVGSVTGGIDCGVACAGLVESVTCGVNDGRSGAAYLADATTSAAASACCFGRISSGSMSYPNRC